MSKPLVVIDKAWYAKNHVSRQLPKPASHIRADRRPPTPKPCPSRAEIALQEWRRATTSEHMAQLSEAVTALQFGLCADCLKEVRLRAIPKKVVPGHWLNLTTQDVLGVCQPCRKARIDSHELHTRGQEVLILDKGLD